MHTEEFAVFLSNQSITTVRASKSEWCCNDLTGTESLPTDFALVLTITAVVVVNVVMRSATDRADRVFGNGSTMASLNRLNRFFVLPKIVFQKELPVLFGKLFNDRKSVNLVFLILGTVKVIVSPLF